MPIAEGQLFAGYTIVRVLGAGGMGEVYLAEHPRLPRNDALKVLGPRVSDDAEYRQRFNQEAEMVARLHHPNIVTIYDRGECEGRLWISMEFVDGTDTYRLMNEKYRGGLPAELVVRIVTAVAEALDFAHSRDVLHRDVKPANILLGGDYATGGTDRIMLADFGVARWVSRASDLTGTEVTVGTVTYAPPEQLTGRPLDGRADQYALAATAFHLMTGNAPFDDSNPAVVIGQHISAEPPAIGTYRPELAGFGPVFARAMAKEPRDRYDRCRDFAQAMQRALGPAGRRPGRHQRFESQEDRRRWVGIGLAGLVLLGAGAAGFALLGKDRGALTGSAPNTPPPPAISARMDLPVVLLGADCAVLGAAAVTESGTPAYCARPDPAGQQTVWSPQSERLRTAASAPPATGSPPAPAVPIDSGVNPVSPVVSPASP